jgi:hypothetical protein
MAIPPSGTFNYTARLRLKAPGRLQGRAEPSNPRYHPGMLGNRPAIELAGGVVTVRTRESWLSQRLNSHYRSFPLRTSAFSIRVGAVVASIVEDGDVLGIGRDPCGELSVRIYRNDALLAAFGAVAGTLLKGHATVEEDPRAYETRLYSITGMLEKPGAALAWFHASDPDLGARIADLWRITGKDRIIVAIAGKSEEERLALNHRVASSDHQPGGPAHYYYDVGDGFDTPDQWLAYLRTLPTSRPTDLWIRIGIDGESSLVREGEYVLRRPWHLFVQRVYRLGLPGDPSQIAIVREHPVIGRDDVIETTRLLASRDMRLR